MPPVPKAAPSTAVQLEGVDVTFGTGAGAYRAVTGATLSVATGEFVAIVGPTGCGKSTLLNVVAGLLRPAAGQALVQGRPVDGIVGQAGYLFQA